MAKKTKKKATKKREGKLKINGNFLDVIKASVAPGKPKDNADKK